MAFRTQKISQMTPKGANLEATDLIEVSTIESGSYVTRSITGQEIIDAAVGNVDWGDIGGTLSAQTDLQSALDAKVPTSRTLTINGVTQDLSANRTFTISTGITIGSTAIASGTVGRVLFEGAGNVVQESSSLSFDDTAKAFTLSGNQNNTTYLTISNTTAGTSSNASLQLISDVASGQAQVFKYSSTRTAYKTLAANDFGHYNATAGDISFLNDVPNGKIKFATNQSNTAQMTLAASGNVLIGTTTDAGFKLDVNGTARVQGQLTTSVNQNNPTRISITNTFSGALAGTEILLNTNSSALMAAGKVSNAYTPYKTLAAGDGYLYNTTFGDISLLNDFATGRIKFAAGGASTAQMSIFSTGNVGINTTTDAGFRLDVNGTARVKGTGTTSGTTAFTVQSSNGNNSLKVRDDNKVAFGNSSIDCTITGTSGSGNKFEFYAFNGYDVIDGFGNVLVTGLGDTIRLPRNVGIGFNTQNNASAVLQVDSTTKGFLPPRMTTTQKNAIASPAAGLVVYDTTLNKLCVYTTAWETVTSL